MQSSRSESPNGLEFIGIAISGDTQQRHTGILYKMSAKENYQAIHLAGHYNLRNDNFNETFLWQQCPYEKENLLLMAAGCKRCATKMAKKIPYGFNAEDISFDPENGTIVLGEHADGMTCASFVMAFFEQFGYELLDVTTWQSRDDDEEWQMGIINILENLKLCTKEHLVKMKNNLPCYRFKPEEVVAAGSREDIPLDFDTAKKIGLEIVEQLLAPLKFHEDTKNKILVRHAKTRRTVAK